jgi:hypothetical protein
LPVSEVVTGQLYFCRCFTISCLRALQLCGHSYVCTSVHIRTLQS